MLDYNVYEEINLKISYHIHNYGTEPKIIYLGRYELLHLRNAARMRTSEAHSGDQTFNGILILEVNKFKYIGTGI